MAKVKRTNSFLTDDDWVVLARVCDDAGVSPNLVERMIVEENKVYGMGRRHGIHEVLADLINDALGAPSPEGGGK